MYSLLIVEDEDFIRKGIVSLIDYKSIGIDNVYQADNGLKALDIVKENKPDIVLTDINMPQMDGINFAKKVKLYYPNTHIIFLTGYDYVDYLLSALKLGATDYILKPVSKKEIESLLIKVVSKLDMENRKEEVNTLITNSKQDVKIGRIIDEQISNPDLSLKLLAQQLNFSPTYLSTIIKKELGVSFQDYIINQRIQKAKILLLTTNMKIYEIAEEVGMSDVNYFSSRFKQIVKKTPKQYQKEVIHE